MKTIVAEPNVPIRLRKSTDHKFVCCGCGLVHRFRFETTGLGDIELVVSEDRRSTERERRRVLGDEYDIIARRYGNEERMDHRGIGIRRDGDRRGGLDHPVVHRRKPVAASNPVDNDAGGNPENG